jgi:subtilase family serine protease
MSQEQMSTHVLPKSARDVRPGAKRTTAADPAESFTVSVRVRRPRGAPSLADPVHAAMAPKGHRNYPSREEFAATYGASQADLDKVAAFAKAHGLEVVESDAARRTVVLKGTTAQFSKAFAVELTMYKSASETYRGREGEIHLPADLVDVVEGVFGLDNRRMAGPHLAIEESAKKDRVAADASPVANTVALTPPQVAGLYGFPTSPNATGQTIAIFEFGGGFKTSDVQLFYTHVGATMPSITTVSVDGQPNSPGTDSYTTETLLDIDVAGSVAPGAKLVVYFAPWTEQGWVDIVTKAVHDAVNHPSVISISYGWPENMQFGSLDWSLQAIQAVNQTFQEAAAMGVSIFVSSGDQGSHCQATDAKAHVEYPGTDPYVTCCGGTVISNVSGASFTENTWTPTGGGVSDIFKAPAFAVPIWQNWAGAPASINDGHRGRVVPDVAGNASPASGYLLYQNGAAVGPVGGTSATAPLYAGLAALLNAALAEPVGYLNPNLYALPYGYVFRDINDAASNAFGGSPGYKSGPGYDACTGLGSLNGTALEHALRGVGLPVALETFNGKLYMAWKGIERDDRIFYSSFNGTTWTPQQMIPGIGSSSGVSLAVYAGKLYMAWKGVLGDQGIWYSSFNGTTWAPQQLVPGIGTSVGPRLAVLGNNLFMAWKGVENDQRIFFNQFNGTTWTAQQLVPGVATSVGPAVANFNGAIYMAWKGMNGDQGIYWSKFNGTSFAPQQIIPGVGSSEGPSLAVFNGALYASWKGIFADQTMWYASFNGTTWTAQKQVPNEASSVGPGLAVFGNGLYAAWKGMNGDQGIWYSHFNGAAWASQHNVSGVGTSPDLVAMEETV